MSFKLIKGKSINKINFELKLGYMILVVIYNFKGG